MLLRKYSFVAGSSTPRLDSMTLRRSLLPRVCFLLFLSSVLLIAYAGAQQQTLPATRKVISRPTPPYPELARRMGLVGVVKATAIVAPDGTVRSVEIRGGHPVLAQSAAKSIQEWRWEPAAHDSTEQVEVRFVPPE